METKPFKVMEWLRSIRDEHYEEQKTQPWQDDNNNISQIAKKTNQRIEQIKQEDKIQHNKNED
jgi:hypothetical protein